MSCMPIFRTLHRSILHAITLPRKFPNSINYQQFQYLSYCRMTPKKRALVFLAPGFEETELVTAVDILRRGGVEVVLASTEGPDVVCGSHQIAVHADIDLKEVISEKFDALVLPGGLGGSEAMAHNKCVGEMLQEQEKECRIIAAICAAPTALQAHGIGKGKCITSYPAMEKVLTECGHYKYQQDDVVVDEYLITSRGPATAMKFALMLLKQLTDDVKAQEVAKALLCI